MAVRESQYAKPIGLGALCRDLRSQRSSEMQPFVVHVRKQYHKVEEEQVEKQDF